MFVLVSEASHLGLLRNRPIVTEFAATQVLCTVPGNVRDSSHEGNRFLLPAAQLTALGLRDPQLGLRQTRSLGMLYVR